MTEVGGGITAYYKINSYYYHLEGICEAVDWYRLVEVLRSLSLAIEKSEAFTEKIVKERIKHLHAHHKGTTGQRLMSTDGTKKGITSVGEQHSS